MRWLGIDPGLGGGLALLSADGLLLEPMPLLPGGREIDEAALAGLLLAWRGGVVDEALTHRAPPLHAVLERVGARPGQGVVSMFRFGQSVGLLRGMLSALHVPHTLVPPQTWQRKVLGNFPKGTSKAAAQQRAQQIWPAQDWRASERSRTPHTGLIDAALLAEYGRLTLAGAL